MKTEQQYFEEGRSIQEYMEEMSTFKEESFFIYEQFQLPADGLVERLEQADLHVLVITEDWCGDAMLINPIIRKLAEAARIEMRAIPRDEDTDLIDRHLTNGGRAIPIILLLDGQGNLVGKWGPRAPEVQRLVEEARAALPPKDDPSFTEKQKEMYTALTNRFVDDQTLWSYVYESFKKSVLAAIS